VHQSESRFLSCPLAAAPGGRYHAPVLRSCSVALALCFGFSALGCVETLARAETNAEYRQNAKLAYDEALVAYLDRDWLGAEEQMSAVMRDYARTRYARLAELRLADIAFHQAKYPEAIGAYRTFAHDHPNDPEVPYARFRIARSQFLESDESFFSPPLEERDLAHAHDAYAGIRAFIELYVARFYLTRDQFEAAVARAQYALRNYPGSDLEPEAIVLLGETYLKMHKPELARASFQHVLRQYPSSAFTVPARQFLDHMGPQGL
jgi:outer membrane protein assembly factor BamD